MTSPADKDFFDLVVIGAGPAGEHDGLSRVEVRAAFGDVAPSLGT